MKVGDRVRVRNEDPQNGYHVGDEGAILRVETLATTRIRYYLVAMDKDGPEATGVLFNADDIEPDV